MSFNTETLSVLEAVSPGDYFFALFLATILCTRMFLYLKPISSPTIGPLRLHHYMYGGVLVICAYIWGSIEVFGIGLALFIDEVPFLLLSGEDHSDNYSWPSLIGVLLLTAVVFELRHIITRPIV